MDRETRIAAGPSQGDELRENLLLAFDMFDAGLTLMREKLRRDHPGDSEEAIEQRLIAWLSDRPPDAPVRPSS